MRNLPEKLILVEDLSLTLEWWESAIADLSWILWVKQPELYQGNDIQVKLALERVMRLTFSPDGIHPDVLALAEKNPTVFADRAIAHFISVSESFDQAISALKAADNTILWLDFKLDTPTGGESFPHLTEHFVQHLEQVIDRLPEALQSDWSAYPDTSGGACLALHYQPTVESSKPIRILVPSSGRSPTTLGIWGRKAVTKPAAMRQGLQSVYASILIGLNKWAEIQDLHNKQLQTLWKQTDHWFIDSESDEDSVPHRCPEMGSEAYETVTTIIKETLQPFFEVPSHWLEQPAEWRAFYSALKDLLGRETAACRSTKPGVSSKRSLRIRSAVLLLAIAAPGEWLNTCSLANTVEWPLVPDQTPDEATRTCETFVEMIRKLSQSETGSQLREVHPNQSLRLKLSINCVESTKGKPLLRSLIREDRNSAGDSGKALIDFVQAVRKSNSRDVKRCAIYLRPTELGNATMLEISTWNRSS